MIKRSFIRNALALSAIAALGVNAAYAADPVFPPQKPVTLVVGFAAETQNVAENGRSKLERKGADYIIANDVSRADSGFGTDTNKAWIVSTAGTQELPVLTKPQLADTILDLLKNI